MTLSLNFHSARLTSTSPRSNVHSPGSTCSAGRTLYEDRWEDAEIEIASESSGTDDRSELKEDWRRDLSKDRTGGARSRLSDGMKALWGRMVVVVMLIVYGIMEDGCDRERPSYA